MRSFLRNLLVLAAILGVSGALFLNFLLGRIARSEDFKRFAEKKAGEYLKARVHIGEIRPFGWNQLALEKILIETPSSEGGSQLLRADRLLFRYQLDQLWNRKFDAPAGVILNNPAILIEQGQFPYRYFEGAAGGGFSMPSLDFKGGEIRYLLSSLGKEILLQGMEGKIQPSSDRKVQVDVRARVSGLIDGKVRIYGVVNPAKNTHDLWLELEDADFAKDIPLPLKALKGRVHWVGKDLFFDGLQGSVYGWETALSGAFLNQGGQPAVNVRLRVGQKDPWIKLDFALSLTRQTLEGTFQFVGENPSEFRGRVHQRGKRFVIDSMDVDPGYQGRGELDFASGNYELSFKKGAKRVAVHSNLRGLDFAMDFHLDHVKSFGLDLVTQGKLFIHAASLRWKGRDFFFKGDFETDYFILDRQPFENLKGSFQLSPLGITGIRSSWGDHFQMTGQATGNIKDPRLKFLLDVANFDLGTVQEFAAKPLPRALGGRLDGKLTLEGTFSKPEVSGVFNIYDGKWGQLNYERGIIQLRGFLPYLPLKDSKIWKGRTSFFLTGALDLRLDNIFAGVKVQTPDKLVIWKGVEAAMHSKDKSLELDTSKAGGRGGISLETRSVGNQPGNENGEVTDSEKERTAVLFGPKLKF
jgi:hypothetical protein